MFVPLEELHEKGRHWNTEEILLDRALKTLPAIDLEKLKPCPESVKKLKNEIPKLVDRTDWLKEKISAQKHREGFSFKSLIENGP